MTGSAGKTGSKPKSNDNGQMMWYFYFEKYAVFRRKLLVLYLKWCVESDYEVKFWFQGTKNEKIDIFFHSLSFITLKLEFFFRNFRLPVTSETSLSACTRRFPITCKKPFDDILSLWPVIWSSDFGYLKKSYLIIIFNAKIRVTVYIGHFLRFHQTILFTGKDRKKEVIWKQR